ncbi:MAG: hypothetical protein LAP21_12320 [Acidobacteriia bacterium]|nr:hypothetical protein [Terriglobia bacterium]
MKVLNTILTIAIFASVPAFSQVEKPCKGGRPQKDAGLIPGVVIEKVEKGSGAEKAGLRKGDFILSWSRAEADGKIDSPFDWGWVEMEQAYLQDVTIRGMREMQLKTWNLGQKSIHVSTRPNFSGSRLRFYTTCEKSKNKIQCLQAAGEQLARCREEAVSAWLLEQAADLQGETASWRKADKIYERILSRGQDLSPLAVVDILRFRGSLFWRHEERVKASEYYEQALAQSRRLGKDNLLTVQSLVLLSSASWYLV